MKAFRIVTLRRGSAVYGVDVASVRKVLRASGVQPLAAAPDFVPGAATVEGRLEVLVDLPVLFGDDGAMSGEEERRLVLVSLGRTEFALVADGVGDVAEIGAEELQPVPPFVGGTRREALRGVVVRGRDQILVLDLSRLLEASELGALESSAPPEAGG